MNDKIVNIDVRPDIAAGREPFSKIMNAASGLNPGQKLLLIAPFEPVPLFRVMEKRGFSHAAAEGPDGVWEIMFTLVSQGAAPSVESTTDEPQDPRRTSAITEFVEVDARGLEPPQPMVRILETLSVLAEGAELRARTDRRPLHLYPELEKRGYQARTEESPEGGFRTCIQRRQS